MGKGLEVLSLAADVKYSEPSGQGESRKPGSVAPVQEVSHMCATARCVTALPPVFAGAGERRAHPRELCVCWFANGPRVADLPQEAQERQ